MERRTMRRIESGAVQGAAGSGSWVAFLIWHCLAGIAAGWTTVGGLLWLNVAGLGSLVMSSDLFPLPLLMMLASFGLTFGSVAVGSAVMALGRSSESAGLAHDRLVHTAPPAASRRIDGPP
jgi:hypothetical protein